MSVSQMTRDLPPGPTLDLSIVAPIYNEEQSIPTLLAELHEALDDLGLSYELVLVDDGSTDGSWKLLRDASRADAALVVLKFRRNFGQTAAMQAGLDASRGRHVVTLDADLQNDPKDIPRMLEKLDEGYDLVAGWRFQRKDAFLSRRLPSQLANGLISRATGVKLHDYGCTLKAMTGDVAKGIQLYGEMHRFIPAVASWMGAEVYEMKVNHRERKYGESKYGIGRTVRVLLDLMTVRFIQTYLGKPMQIFGLLGLGAVAVGSLICSWLAVDKFLFSAELSERPLLLLGVLLIVVGVQFFSFGLIAELLSRTYHESQGKRPYALRQVLAGEGYKPLGEGGEASPSPG